MGRYNTFGTHKSSWDACPKLETNFLNAKPKNKTFSECKN